MGLGIALHYIGMVAMSGGGYACVRPKTGCTDAIAICVSLVALWLVFHLRAETTLTGNIRKIGSAIIMGNAIAGMHYTAMAAVSFQPTSRNTHFVGAAQPFYGMDNSMLVFEIGIATLTILILTGIASFDQRLSAETARAEALRQRRALPPWCKILLILS